VIACLNTGVLKLRGLNRGFDKERYPSCLEKEDGKTHIIGLQRKLKNLEKNIYVINGLV
jgi:hypothetical protein